MKSVGKKKMQKHIVFYEKIGILIQKNIILYLLFTFMMIAVMANKKNLFVDEVLTYGLSNYSAMYITPVDGKTYKPSESFFLEYVAVNEGENRFRYENVWENQSRDTHPPMYYVLVHTICSFFPGKFSIWYAGVINIFFALLTFYAVRCLVRELTRNEKAVIFVSILFTFSAGILSAVTFLRMYTMVMFEVTFVTLLFIREVNRGRCACTWKFYISIILTSTIGALSHYYFIVYLFFLAMVFGIYLLIHKRFRDAGIFVISMLISGGASVAIFPRMVQHMFLEKGHRGEQSIRNLKNSSLNEYLDRLKGFYSFINEQMFGGLLTYVAIVGLIFLILYLLDGRIKEYIRERVFLPLHRCIRITWVLVALPGIFYFLLISKMAVYIADRYLVPVYAVITVAVTTVVYYIGKEISDKKQRYFALSVLAAIIIVNSWKLCRWEYLYLNSTAMLEKAEEYGEDNNICIYTSDWKICPSFYELTKYKSITFFNKDNLNTIENIFCRNDESLIVTVDDSCNAEDIISKILAVCPLLDSYEKITSYGYMSSYHLYSQNLETNQYRLYDYKHVQLAGCNEISAKGNICTTSQDTVVKGTFRKDTGYGILWIDNYVFDIQGGAVSDGSNIRLWDFNATNAQWWKIRENADGTVTLLSTDERLAMTKDPNGNIYLSELNESNELQKWWIEVDE